MKYVNFSPDISHLKRLLTLGLPFVFSTIAVWTLNVSDRFILNYYSGETAVGIYSLADTFANLFHVFLYAPLGLFWAPYFLSYASKNSMERTKVLIEKTTRYLFIVGGIMCLVISLGCGDVLLIFAHVFSIRDGYLQATRLVPLLILGLFLFLMSGRFGNALFVVKKPKYFGIAGIVAAGFNVGLNFLFIPRFGVLGAAMTTAIAYALYIVFIYKWSQDTYPVNYNLKSLAKGSCFLAVAFVLGEQIQISQPWVSLFAKVISGVVIFVLPTWFISGILVRDERQKAAAYIVDGRKKIISALLRRG